MGSLDTEPSSISILWQWPLRVSVVLWGPKGGVKVKAGGGGETRVVGAARDIELGVGLCWWGARQARFWG